MLGQMSDTGEWTVETSETDGWYIAFTRSKGVFLGDELVAKAIVRYHNAALAAEERRANDSIEENVRLMNRLAAEREKVQKICQVAYDWMLSGEPIDKLPNELQCIADREQLAAEREAAKKVCEIYFNIAAEAIGEDAVRQKRDAALAVDW